MATVVNTYEAKTHLSELLERAALGEEIIIARAGKPLARLVALSSPPGDRPLGSAKGRFRLGPDFEEPLPDDLIAEFETPLPTTS
jgi:prevent-host-death family protein